jgi:hypothetical protein
MHHTSLLCRCWVLWSVGWISYSDQHPQRLVSSCSSSPCRTAELRSYIPHPLNSILRSVHRTALHYHTKSQKQKRHCCSQCPIKTTKSSHAVSVHSKSSSSFGFQIMAMVVNRPGIDLYILCSVVWYCRSLSHRLCYYGFMPAKASAGNCDYQTCQVSMAQLVLGMTPGITYLLLIKHDHSLIEIPANLREAHLRVLWCHACLLGEFRNHSLLLIWLAQLGNWLFYRCCEYVWK